MNFYCKIHTIIVLIFIHNLFTKVQFYATTIIVMRRLLNLNYSRADKMLKITKPCFSSF